MTIHHKRVEIFCGTGGVGKTTIATARALKLAKAGKKVLLITIDPAKRLKQILNLPEIENATEADSHASQISVIDGSLFNIKEPIVFHAMLMSAGATLKTIATMKGLKTEFNNSILETLSRPNSGMNEIMSIIEVQLQLDKNFYDTIVLDTPPGKHFIDFLEASEKIKNFFDKSFIEIFEYLGKNISDANKPKGFFNKLISSGIHKLLSYLEKVTGSEFVQEFIDTVLILFKCRDIFLKALSFQDDLKRSEFSNWFLVTSIEQLKTDEASSLNDAAERFLHDDNYLVINKCLMGHLQEWNPTNQSLIDLKEIYLEKENLINTYSANNFKNILKLNEVIDSKPIGHVIDLANQLDQY